MSAKAVGATEKLQLEENSLQLASRRIPPRRILPRRIPALPLPGSAPGEAHCPITFFLRYGKVWTDWRRTSRASADKEETLLLNSNVNEEITAISGYSFDRFGDTCSLQVESSAGRSWGPHGNHRSYDETSFRSSTDASSNGLKLIHISGDHTDTKYILRYLHQHNHMEL